MSGDAVFDNDSILEFVFGRFLVTDIFHLQVLTVLRIQS